MKSSAAPFRGNGFTLVEILVVVTIIGLLAALAIPGIHRARQNSLASTLANNFRVYTAAFEIYSTENGEWPADTTRGKIPVEMRGQLARFTEETNQGGVWDWDNGVAGITAGVSLHQNDIENAVIVKIDEILDDGDVSSGRVQKLGGFLTYILEP